jgi:hypothetical protein
MVWNGITVEFEIPALHLAHVGYLSDTVTDTRYYKTVLPGWMDSTAAGPHMTHPIYAVQSFIGLLPRCLGAYSKLYAVVLLTIRWLN